MSLKQNHIEVQTNEDNGTFEELRDQTIAGLIDMFGAAFSGLSESDQESVKHELGLEFKTHGHFIDEICNTFEKEKSLSFYLERIEKKREVIANAPQDLREHLKGECTTGVMSLHTVSSLSDLAMDTDGWDFYRKYLEREAERNKTGTTWQELPFIGDVRNYFTDEEIEKALTVNGELLDVWGGRICLAQFFDGSFSLVDVSKPAPDGKSKCQFLMELNTPDVWQLITFVLVYCHEKVIDESKDVTVTLEQKVNFARCVLEAFVNSCRNGNRVFTDLARNYSGDFRRGFWHFTHYLFNQWLKTKTNEDKRALELDWHTAKIVMEFQPDYIVKACRSVIAPSYRAPVNDNRIVNVVLNADRDTVITVPIKEVKFENSKRVRFPATEFSIVVSSESPELSEADIHVLFAIYAFKERNQPHLELGFNCWYIPIVDLVTQIFPCQRKHVSPDSTIYKFVKSSIERLEKFKHAFDISKVAASRGFTDDIPLSRRSDTLITGKWGYTGTGKVRHETFFLQGLGFLVPIFQITEWANTESIYRDFMPKSINDEDTIDLVFMMLARAIHRNDTINTVPLYQVNDVRVTKGAFSLFKAMRKHGWVDISTDKPEDYNISADALKKRDKRQRERVQSILNWWSSLGRVFSIHTNLSNGKVSSRAKLEWYCARIDIEAAKQKLIGK